MLRWGHYRETGEGEQTEEGMSWWKEGRCMRGIEGKSEINQVFGGVCKEKYAGKTNVRETARPPGSRTAGQLDSAGCSSRFKPETCLWKEVLCWLTSLLLYFSLRRTGGNTCGFEKGITRWSFWLLNSKERICWRIVPIHFIQMSPISPIIFELLIFGREHIKISLLVLSKIHLVCLSMKALTVFPHRRCFKSVFHSEKS